MESLTSLFTTSVKGNKSALTSDQKKLFNGYDELGGDLIKYDQAADWFDNVKNKPVTLVACIAVLDKPSSWLFGGVQNSETKDVLNLRNTFEKERSEMVRAQSDDVKKYHVDRIKEIVDECKHLKLVGDVITLDVHGKSTFDTKLIDYMSMFEDHEIMSLTAEQITAMSLVRSFWKDDFRGVNVSRMKRVALMYLELCDEKKMISQASQWIKNHGGRPSQANKFGKATKTIEINKASLSEFISDKQYWQKHKSVFNIQLTAANIPHAPYIPSAEMIEFRGKMTVSFGTVPRP